MPKNTLKWQRYKSFITNIKLLSKSILGEKDGPIQHLLKVMRKHNFEQPESWRFLGDEDDH